MIAYMAVAWHDGTESGPAVWGDARAALAASDVRRGPRDVSTTHPPTASEAGSRMKRGGATAPIAPENQERSPPKAAPVACSVIGADARRQAPHAGVV